MDKITVLTPKQLSERWQISLTKVYEDNNAGLLPQLPGNKTRFPLIAIEEMEKEPMFEKNNIRTPRERKLEKELDVKEIQLKEKDNKIKELEASIAEIQTITLKMFIAKNSSL
jgi:hypothetical protein